MGSQEILSIGKASIFNSYPDWLAVKVGSNFNGAAGPANPIDGKPVPTNKWFSPLFWWTNNLDYDDGGSAIALRPMPGMLQVSPWGLMLTYRHKPEYKCGGDGDPLICGWPDNTQAMGCSNWTNWRFDRSPNTIFASMVISVDKLLVDKKKTPFFVRAADYGDWDVALQWDDGERRLRLEALAGGPSLYGTASGGELELQLPAADNDRRITFYNGEGKSLGQAYMGASPGPDFTSSKDGVIGMAFKTIEGDTVYYAIFAPKGTTWSFTQGTTGGDPTRGANLSKLRSTNLAKGSEPFHFTVAVLPPPPAGIEFPVLALQAFAASAGLQVSKTIFSWDPWDTAKGTITAHYTFDVQAVADGESGRSSSIITTLFKPHQKLADGMGSSVAYLLNEKGEPYSYNSPRGPLKLVRIPVQIPGNTAAGTARYSVTYPYYGYVPALPDLSLSGEELTALRNYLSADSRQTSATTADFLDDVQPDAYSSGTKLYYKLMQTVYWLHQLRQVESIPDFRGKGSAGKEEIIPLLVRFLKADLETFFSATRPEGLAYQWHFLEPEAQAAGPDCISQFRQVDGETLPRIFPCRGDAQCNPAGDPLLGTGPCWKLTQQDLIDAQKKGRNPWLVLRDLDFTVNKFAGTGPTTDMLLHYAWKQTDPKQSQDIKMYAFFAPAGTDPCALNKWTQCVWTDEESKGKIGLKLTSNTGIGHYDNLPDTGTPWRIGNIPYNGTSTSAPNRITAGRYDIMLVFDCGADCYNFPAFCNFVDGQPPIPPNVAADVWKGWELTIGAVHFEGKPYKFLAYNQAWNALLGNTSWYGSIENLADHHFGWGYLVKAAALIAQFDTEVERDTGKPWWDIEKGWGGIVNLMIRDVMDWRRPGEADPHGLAFVHCKYLNPVEGHMYSNGHGNTGIGNDEESSSEAINFANACIEWGAATGQNDIRDMGILLRSIYAQAVPTYWFNVDGDVLPSTTADKPFPIAGQITGAGNQHETYFSGGPGDAGCPSRNSDVVAIQALPITAGTLGMTLFTPQLKVAWETVMNAGGPYCGATGKCYLSTLLSFQSLVDPAGARASFLQRANPGQPFTSWYNYLASTRGLKQPENHSYATTWAFILSMGRLGAAKAETLASPDANPFYMPMADGSLLVYNPTRTERTFSVGGRSVTVPGLGCVRVEGVGSNVAASARVLLASERDD